MLDLPHFGLQVEPALGHPETKAAPDHRLAKVHDDFDRYCAARHMQ